MQIRWLLFFLLIMVGAPPHAETEVAPGTFLVPGVTQAGAQPDGNSIIIEAPQGLIVFDTGRHPAHTQQILDFAQARGRPVKAIINSHWHLDHIGGNLMLRSAYPAVLVYASPALHGALSDFLARYREQLVEFIAKSAGDPAAQDSMRAEIALIDAGPALGPTVVVQASGRRTIAGYDLELNYERAAVTAGDVWAFDPRTRVLLAGDLVTLPAPFFDTACPRRWRAALQHLSQARFRTLVPGHGAPMDHAGLGIYRTAFDGLLRCAESDAPKAECIDGWMRDADALLPEEDRDYARAALDYYLDQVLRGQDDRIAGLCATPKRLTGRDSVS